MRLKFRVLFTPNGVKFEPSQCKICQRIQWNNWFDSWNSLSVLNGVVHRCIAFLNTNFQIFYNFRFWCVNRHFEVSIVYIVFGWCNLMAISHMHVPLALGYFWNLQFVVGKLINSLEFVDFVKIHFHVVSIVAGCFW